MATKGWLQTHGHSYIEKNISQNPEYATELMSLGYRVTPVTLIDGDAVVGFIPTKLQEFLS